MKRISFLFLFGLLLICLTGCKNNKSNENNTTTKVNIQESTTTTKVQDTKLTTITKEKKLLEVKGGNALKQNNKVAVYAEYIGKYKVTLTGPKETLDKFNIDDSELFIDVEPYKNDEGTKSIEVKLNVPDGITYTVTPRNIQVGIGFILDVDINDTTLSEIKNVISRYKYNGVTLRIDGKVVVDCSNNTSKGKSWCKFVNTDDSREIINKVFAKFELPQSEANLYTPDLMETYNLLS